MTDTWLLALLGGVFALFLGRSAIIAIWPDSEAARFCEHKLGFHRPCGRQRRRRRGLRR
jgi:hypothetical protein